MHAKGEQVADQLLLDGVGEYEHFDRGQLLAQRAGDVAARMPPRLWVKQHHVRPQVARQSERFAAVARGSDRDNIRRGVEFGAGAGTEQRMVLDQEHTDHAGSRLVSWAPRRAGGVPRAKSWDETC